jgi:hypothetical protein
MATSFPDVSVVWGTENETGLVVHVFVFSAKFNIADDEGAVFGVAQVLLATTVTIGGLIVYGASNDSVSKIAQDAGLLAATMGALRTELFTFCSLLSEPLAAT